MSQASLQISTNSPLSGLNVVFGFDNAVKALASLQSSSLAPTQFSTGSTALREGQAWLDTGNSPHVVRLYDGASFQPSFLANTAADAVFLYANFGVL
jgi:hypothetical protein